MKPQIKVIVPKDLAIDQKRLNRAIENGLDASAQAAKADFDVTTQTWKTDVTFSIKKRNKARRVTTSNRIYGYVNDGTRPHIIRPKRARVLTFLTPYRAKTKPRKIRSGRGGVGNTIIYTKIVQHPGTQAREFDKTIQEKWQRALPTTMQRTIDSEVR
jgi:hypothetical protein